MGKIRTTLFQSLAIALTLAWGHFCFSDEGQENLEFYGHAWMQSGQFANYKYGVKGHELSNQWIQNNMVGIGLRSQFHPRLKGALGIDGWLSYNTFPDSMLIDPARVSKGAAIALWIDQAKMTVKCSPDPEDSLADLHIGYFPFKYNREARNLGEYMFRTGCYPGYIYSDGFDFANAPLAGFRVSSDFLGMWHNDLFLTTELYLYPMNDFSLTWLTDATLGDGVLNIGGGIQLYHCLPVNNDYTQPKYYQTNVVVPGQTPYAPNYYFDKNDPLHEDTLFYTFAGTKLMARFAFDPKPLLGLDIFGAEDLKLYAEAIVLGVKNYPANPDPDPNWNMLPVNEFGYEKLMQKMPVMMGLNLPAFKIIDVLALELEYYGKKYANRSPVVTQGLGMMRLPVPYDPQLNGGEPNGSRVSGGDGTYSKEYYYGGAAQWKWSLYLKKTLLGNLSITSQIARDHSRVQTSLAQSIDQEEALIKDKQWYWMLKFGYDF
ncbi:MAG: hypothetical protein JXA71_18250 [Chitinispirillaceae bacterium]|nr:hypothetical protein [Chitinispirillaceae bacterium]